MTPDVARVLLGERASPEDVCAAIRWVAPWVEARHSEEAALVALELAEQLSPTAQAVWQWWVGCRYPELVDLESVMADSGLTPGLAGLLPWCMRQGGEGLVLYVSLREAAKDYEQALRELERHCRDFKVMTSVVQAVRNGAEDLGPTYANLPGRYDYPGLKGRGIALVNRALAERDLAMAAGIRSDFPSVGALPRFAGLPGSERLLLSALLYPLLDGPPLEGHAIAVHSISQVEQTEGTALLVRLHRRGLPVEASVLGEAGFWLSQLGSEDCELDGSQGEGPRAVRAFRRVLDRRESAVRWWQSLEEATPFWSGHWDFAASAADDVLARHGLDRARVELASAAGTSAGQTVRHVRARALAIESDDLVGAWALSTVMDVVLKALHEAEEVFAW